MKKIELEIVALSHSLAQSQNYAVVLGERDAARRLPIVIGSFEAQAIAVAMEGMTPSRPMTHDLLQNTLQTFNVDLKEVIVSDLVDGIFHARLICTQGEKTIEIDSRTSDALALAVRFGCPIYTYEFILEQAGIVLEEDVEREVQRAKQLQEDDFEEDMPRTLQDYSPEELQELLDEVLAQEDYERAAEIRDEMQRRENN